LMRRAKAFANEQMASRGLLNSSLNTTAGYAAMIDKALPIAQSDAQTHFKQGLTNQSVQNQAALTNTNWQNKLAEESHVAQMDFWRQSNLAGQQYGYDIGKINQANQWKSQLLAQEYGLKNDLQRANLGARLQEVYLNNYREMLKQLDAVLVDPNTDDASKRAIVNRYVTSISRMRDSMRALGMQVPNFDFTDYYVP